MARKAAAPNLSFLNTPALPTKIFASSTTPTERVLALAIDALEDNPFQPRLTRDEEQLEQLSEVIGTQGFQGVLLAREHPANNGRFQLAFGHRRRDAARMAGLQTIPVVVREMDDQEMVEIAITENVQREDLTPLDEGRTYLMMQQQLGYTQEQIATAVGKKRGYIVNRLRLATAPEDVQQLLEEKPDSVAAAATLVQIEDAEVRTEMIAGVRAGSLKTIDVRAQRRAIDDAPNMAASNPAAQPATPQALQAVEPSQLRTQVAEPTPPAYKPDTETTQTRLGLLKLATAKEALLKFQHQAGRRGEISPAELEYLMGLREMVERMYNNYSRAGGA